MRVLYARQSAHTHTPLSHNHDPIKQTNKHTNREQTGRHRVGQPLGDLDLDLQALFPILNEATGEREFIVERKWIPLRELLSLFELLFVKKCAASGSPSGELLSLFELLFVKRRAASGSIPLR